VPKGAPGRHGVGERHPDAAVHVAAGVEVAAVDLEPALHLVVVDPDHLDAEVPGKAARDTRAEQLRRDRRVRQAAALSSRASPS
jgi:hypothetical protein